MIKYRIGVIYTDGTVDGFNVEGNENMEMRVLECMELGTKKIIVLNKKTGEKKVH